MPNVFISPHTNSITPQTIGRAFKILEEDNLDGERGERMINVIKKAREQL